MLKFIKAFFHKRAEKKAMQEAKTKNLINSYEYLIKQYGLIMEEKSRLSRRKRKEIILTVAHLVAKGHIIVNPPKQE
jgi:hypothetical protein